MARDSTTTASGFFKTRYRDYMGNDQPKASSLWMEIDKRGKKEVAGGTSLNTTWTNNSADGVGMGALTEAGDYATPVASVPKQFSLGLAHLQFTVGFSGHLLAQGSSKKSSWTGDYIKKKAKELRDKARSIQARFAMSDGTGNFGQIAAVSGTTNGYFTLTGSNYHFFNKQETVTVRDAASSGTEQLTGGAGSGLIVDIDPENGRVYCADVSGAAANDYVAISGFYDATVPNGIQNIVSNSGTIQGLARGTAGNFFARSIYYDASSAALTANHIDLLRDTVEDVAGEREGSYSSSWVCNREMRRWMTLATIGQNRFAGLDSLEIGKASMKVGDKDGSKTVIESPYITSGDLYACDFSTWVIAYPEGMRGGYPVEGAGGGVIWQGNAASGPGHADHQLMYWVLRTNIGNDNFRCQGRRTSIASP